MEDLLSFPILPRGPAGGPDTPAANVNSALDARMDDSDPKPPQVDGRRRRSKQTKQAIIDAYLDLVRANHKPPTAPQIAKRAGISTRSVFERFTDLLTLSLAVADYAFEQAMAQAAVPNLDADLHTRLKAQVRCGPQLASSGCRYGAHCYATKTNRKSCQFGSNAFVQR